MANKNFHIPNSSIENPLRLNGIIIEGHQVASGQGASTPYPESSIKMQTPHFKEKGLDISMYYSGTLNVSIKPYRLIDVNSPIRFDLVEWTFLHPPETFSFSKCKVIVNGEEVSGLVYYPHPSTKETHFQNNSVLEILTTYIDNIKYGDEIEIVINQNEVIIE